MGSTFAEIGGVVSGQQTHLAQNRQASIDAAAVGQSRLLAASARHPFQFRLASSFPDFLTALPAN